jgi:hypothetical protein
MPGNEDGQGSKAKKLAAEASAPRHRKGRTEKNRLLVFCVWEENILLIREGQRDLYT